MKHFLPFLIEFVGCLGAISFSLNAQGTFQNLDFEAADPIFVSGSQVYVTAASALPDWTVNLGTDLQTEVTYNNPSFGSTWVSIVGPGHGAIDGNYSVLLQNGGTASLASISQTGLIPITSESLFFEAEGVGPLEVFIGNQNVPFSVVSTGPNYNLYQADISAWSGHTEQLTFSAQKLGVAVTVGILMT